MKKNDNVTEIVFILDRSGSMGGLVNETIGGFNSLLAKQQEEEGDALVSVVLFDNEVEILHDRVDINKIKPMDNEQYYVRGCTALLDAIGSSIKHIKNVHKNEDNPPSKTLFIITTDGYENASSKYSYSKIKKMVTNAKEKRNWEFMFLGANIDAISVADSFGISANRAATYVADKVGTSINFRAMSKAVSAARCAGSAMEMGCALDDGEILDEVRNRA
jgi:uncharacterized protein YegL